MSYIVIIVVPYSGHLGSEAKICVHLINVDYHFSMFYVSEGYILSLNESITFYTYTLTLVQLFT